MASEGHVRSMPPRRGLIISAVVFSVLAGAAAYGGVAVALTLAISNGNAKAAAAATAYVLGAFGAPILSAIYLARRRRWGSWQAVRFAAVVSLLVHAMLLPVALAAFAM
jgi:hypothetical protein